MASTNSLSNFTAVAPRSTASRKASFSRLATRSAVSVRGRVGRLVFEEMEVLESSRGLSLVRDELAPQTDDEDAVGCLESEELGRICESSEDTRVVSIEDLGRGGNADSSGTLSS
jgi:hypothetical protein